MCTHIHTYKHACIHMCTHIDTHTYTCTHTTRLGRRITVGVEGTGWMSTFVQNVLYMYMKLSKNIYKILFHSIIIIWYFNF